MTVLPIVARELRVAARRRGTYWSRVGSALVALVICSYVFVMTSQFNPQGLGFMLFATLAWLSWVYALFSGVRLTADCISVEKREGTLGLLFLTDLKGYDVAGGKLAACSLNAVYGLLAMIPVLALSLMFGGVSARQFYRVVAVLLNTMFCSLAVGLVCSTFLRRSRRAAALALILVAVGAVGPFLFAMALMEWGHLPPEDTFDFMAPSPGFGLWVALEFGGLPRFPKGLLLKSLLMVNLVGWLALILASAWLPRVWQERPVTALGARLRERWKQWCYGSHATRAAFRRRLLGVNPFLWLAARDRLKPAYVWLYLTVGAAYWLLGFLYYRDTLGDPDGYPAFTMILQGVFKFWLGAAVVERLAQDRQSTALELILSTPLSVRQIFRGQLRALARQFGGPLLVLLLGDALLCYGALRQTYSDRAAYLVFYIGHGLMLGADALAIAWVGQWMAVSARNPSHASASTLVRVLVWPWLIFLGSVTLYSIFRVRGPSRFDPSGEVVMAYAFAIALITDIVLIIWAHRRLRRDFRTVATQRFETQRAGWLRLLFGAR